MQTSTNAQTQTHSTKTYAIVDMSGLIYTKAHAYRNAPAPVEASVTSILQYLNRPPFYANRIICVFDGPNGKDRRKAIYPEYKAQRKESDLKETVTEVAKRTREILQHSPYIVVYENGMEADDAIAAIAEKIKGNVLVISGDRDLYQLTSPRTDVITFKGDLLRYACTPEQFLMMKILTGDPSDNIKGIAGVGPKNAEKIVTHYETYADLYDYAFTSDGLGKNSREETVEILERNNILMRLTPPILLSEQEKSDILESIAHQWGRRAWDVVSACEVSHLTPEEIRTMELLKK